MTRVNVITFAHEADEYLDNGNQVYAFSFDELQRAFEAVAAHEREACAKVCDEQKRQNIKMFFDDPSLALGAEDCADAIRARATTQKEQQT